jgi:hypothetical protein
VDQIVQMVGALLDHLMTSSPGATNDQSTTGRPGRPGARRKRRMTASEGAHGAADDDAAVPQVKAPGLHPYLPLPHCFGLLLRATAVASQALCRLQLLMPPDALCCNPMFDVFLCCMDRTRSRWRRGRPWLRAWLSSAPAWLRRSPTAAWTLT